MVTYYSVDFLRNHYQQFIRNPRLKAFVRKFFETPSFYYYIHKTEEGHVHVGTSPITNRREFLICSAYLTYLETCLLDYLQVDLTFPEPIGNSGCSCCVTDVGTPNIVHHIDYKNVLETINMADSILSQRDHIESIREEIEFHRHEMKNQGQPVVYFSVDVETWEKNHDVVTEIGWSVKYFNPQYRTQSNHFVISEHSEYRNGKYVPDAKFLFNFGTYKFISLSNSIYAMNGALEYWRDSGYQIYMICHDSRKDQEWLENAGLYLEDCTIIDTQDIYYGRTGTIPRIGLSNMLPSLGIKFKNLHNADKFFPNCSVKHSFCTTS